MMSVTDTNLPGDGTVLTEAVRRARGAFVTVAVFSMMLNLVVLASPLYMLQVYDRVLSSGKVETLIMLTIILAVALMVWAALDQLRTGITVRVGAWFNRALGPFYLESGIRARLDGQSGGGQAFRDLSQIQSFVATQGMTALFDAPWTPVFIAVIWMMHPWLGMLAVTAATILLLLSFLYEWIMRVPLATANAKQIATQSAVDAAVQNAEAVSAMGMVPALVHRWIGLTEASERDLIVANRRGGFVTGMVRFLRMFFQSAILGLGAYLVIRNEATPGTMIAASILLGRALTPVDQALGAWKGFTSARLAWHRLADQARGYPLPKRRLSMPAPAGGLKLADVTVVAGPRPVLWQVDFEVEPGEALAIIGPSAAGKSTLCRAIVGLAPLRSGTVQLDGVDMSLWNSDELGPHIGFLPQEPALFAGTIRENIARMQEAPDEKIAEAARLAHAHEMIALLPDGYETVLGEGGAGLSGGQRQRIGLARAVFGKPSLIVLDEPNSHLDQTGEAALAEAILELKAHGSTLIIVGHRPSTLAQADKLLLLQDGVVQAFGPRNEILERMRLAAQAQAGESEEDDEESDGDEPESEARSNSAETASQSGTTQASARD